MARREQLAVRRWRSGFWVAAGLLAAALSPIGPARARVSAPPSPALRVLIVGNSYVRFNVLPHLLAKLAASAKAGPRLLVDAEARNGFSLHMHLRTGLALMKIRSGHYDAVVLQGHSMSAVDHPDQLAEDAERFKREIDATGARTLLYETWPRSPGARLYRKHPRVHSYEEMAGQLGTTYAGIALHLGAQLAPIGTAFERALVEEPELVLWGPDGSHPTLAGSFLAACVLYGVIASEDPRDASYVPINMKPDRGAQIKALAERTLSGARAGTPPARFSRALRREPETSAPPAMPHEARPLVAQPPVPLSPGGTAAAPADSVPALP